MTLKLKESEDQLILNEQVVENQRKEIKEAHDRIAKLEEQRRKNQVRESF